MIKRNKVRKYSFKRIKQVHAGNKKCAKKETVTMLGRLLLFLLINVKFLKLLYSLPNIFLSFLNLTTTAVNVWMVCYFYNSFAWINCSHIIQTYYCCLQKCTLHHNKCFNRTETRKLTESTSVYIFINITYNLLEEVSMTGPKLLQQCM